MALAFVATFAIGTPSRGVRGTASRAIGGIAVRFYPAARNCSLAGRDCEYAGLAGRDCEYAGPAERDGEYAGGIRCSMGDRNSTEYSACPAGRQRNSALRTSVGCDARWWVDSAVRLRRGAEVCEMITLSDYHGVAS
jgi:hypothetical protein